MPYRCSRHWLRLHGRVHTGQRDRFGKLSGRHAAFAGGMCGRVQQVQVMTGRLSGPDGLRVPIELDLAPRVGRFFPTC